MQKILWALTGIWCLRRDAAQDTHLRNVLVPNSTLKETQVRMMRGQIRLGYDPMVDRYEQAIAGRSFDPENDENTLKSLTNINTPLVLRVPATQDIYLAALHH